MMVPVAVEGPVVADEDDDAELAADGFPLGICL